MIHFRPALGAPPNGRPKAVSARGRPARSVSLKGDAIRCRRIDSPPITEIVVLKSHKELDKIIRNLSSTFRILHLPDRQVITQKISS